MFLKTISVNQDIIKAISTCIGYLALSAATFVAFQKEEGSLRLCHEELLKIVLVDRNIA